METARYESKYTSRRIIAVTCTVMAFSIIAVITIFHRFYAVSKQTIIGKWQTVAVQTANRVNYYMQMPIDAIEFSAVSVNAMSRAGASHEEVGEYLINETQIYSSTINENSTGIYGYYKGLYLDGSGWIPPDDYKPTERPWFKEAVDGQGKVTLVQPYLNLQTMTMMMSVCKLLDDGSSVISMDIFLDSVQNEIAKLSEMGFVKKSYVIDKDGHVVASSNIEEIGLTLQVSSILEAEKDETSFSVPVNSEWDCVLIMNNKKLFHSLYIIYVMSGVVLFIVIVMISAVFVHISKKYKEAESLNDEVRAIADIYQAVVRFEIPSDSLTTIQCDTDYNEILSECSQNWSQNYLRFSEKVAAGGAALIARDFLNPLTLPARLAGTNSISIEFIDSKEHWVRARYIVVGLTEDGSLESVLLAFESIDEDKRRQATLRKLSETDLMTGIKNRGSGEQQVRQAISEGKHGMFCLMDVDNFKSINDTFGHQIGDEVIKAIANCLKRTFRDSDIIFRLGGDEFAVFCIGVNDTEIGDRLLQRFFSQVERIYIPELCERLITLSIGAAFFPEFPKDTFEAMYSRADEGTYKSKRDRGNQISFNSINDIILK